MLDPTPPNLVHNTKMNPVRPIGEDWPIDAEFLYGLYNTLRAYKLRAFAFPEAQWLRMVELHGQGRWRPTGPSILFGRPVYITDRGVKDGAPHPGHARGGTSTNPTGRQP